MTLQQLKTLLLSNHRAVERSILALQHSPQGFLPIHQADGLFFAKEIANHRTLLGNNFKQARRIALLYLDRLLPLSK